MEKKQKTEQTHMKPFAAFNTFINVLMASGPILLPVQVAAAGYGYSVICLILCCIISMIACDFIIEVQNAHLYYDRHYRLLTTKPLKRVRLVKPLTPMSMCRPQISMKQITLFLSFI